MRQKKTDACKANVLTIEDRYQFQEYGIPGDFLWREEPACLQKIIVGLLLTVYFNEMYKLARNHFKVEMY